MVTEYNDSQLPLVLEACERMHAHLTAAIVSNDVHFQNKVLSQTINGTTYCGLRARTTGMAIMLLLRTLSQFIFNFLQLIHYLKSNIH